MSPRVAILSSFLGLLMVGCGKVGPPLAPLRLQPQRPSDVALAQEGTTLSLSFTAPHASVDDLRLPVLDVVIAWSSEKGVDLASAGERIKLQVAPGEHITQVLSPTPAAGTVVRAIVTARARHSTSPAGGPVALVVAKPPLPPEDLVAKLERTGVRLSWKHLELAPAPTPTPSPGPAVPTANSSPPPGARRPTMRPPPPAVPPPASVPPPTSPATGSGEASGAAVPAPSRLPHLPVGVNVYARDVGAETWERVTPSPVVADSYLHENGGAQPACYVARVVLRSSPLVESEPSAESCVEARSSLPLETLTGLRAVATGREVILSWSAATDARTVAVRVYRTAEEGGPTLVAEIKVPTTTARDADPPRDVALSYRLVPVDAQGHEGPSSEADTTRVRNEP